MEKYTLMSLRAMVHNQGVSGKAIAIQGICDMVEEYLGVYRDIFRRELVKSRAILDGALLMWQKKQNKIAQQYLNDAVSYEEVTEMDLHYIDLYYLYPKPVKKTFVQHMNEMTFVIHNDTNLEEVDMNEDEQAHWDQQIALQEEQYAVDLEEHEAYMEEEHKRDCEMEYWSSYRD